MKERIIDIPKSAMRTPDRLVLARVGATMLFPDDEKKGLIYEQAAAALLICEPHQLPEILQWSVREIACAESARFTQGFLAGFVLYEALGGFGKAEIVGRMISCLELDYKKRFGRFSQKTFDNVTWPLFRRVAHFWAATFMTSLEREPFPCALASFKDYLAVVEAFRIAGETTKAKQSPEPSLLRPAETVKLPANLGIRPADLEFLPRQPPKKLLPIKREKTGAFFVLCLGVQPLFREAKPWWGTGTRACSRRRTFPARSKPPAAPG
jgi:hypothetical protein